MRGRRGGDAGNAAERDARIEARVAAASRAAGALGALVGGAVLAAWALDLDRLKSIVPGWPVMLPRSALMHVAAGVSLFVLGPAPPPPRWRRIARVAAGVVVGLAAVSCVEQLAALSGGSGLRAPRRAPPAGLAALLARPSSATAISHLLLGIGLLALDAARPRVRRLADLCALGAASLPLVVLLAFLNGTTQLQAIPSLLRATGMAVHGAPTLLVLAAGLFCARPKQRLVAVLTTSAPGARVGRLLLLGLVAFALMVFVIDLGAQRRLYRPAVAAALVAFLALAEGLSFTLYLAARLNRDNARRRQAERRAEAAHASARCLLERLEAVAAAHLAITDATARIPELGRDGVLTAIVAEARSLTGARVAALGLTPAAASRFTAWVQTGMSPDEAAALGQDPDPLRPLVASLREAPARIARGDPRLAALPCGHPLERSFLGAPVHFRGRTVGYLFLGDKRDAPGFSEEDERVVEMLAARAASAIEAARLYEAVAEERAWLRAAAEQIPDGVLVVNAAGEVLLENEGARALAAEAARRPQERPFLDDLRWPDGTPIPRAHRPMARALAAGEVTAGTELAVPHGGGELLPLLVSVGPVRAGGRIVGAVGVFRNIRERIRRERQERFLAEMGAVLASSLELEQTIANVATLAVRLLADLCLVELTDGDVRRVKVAHRDPDAARAAARLQRSCLRRAPAPLTSSTPAGGQPQLVSEIPPGYLESLATDPEHLAALRALAPRSFMSLPLAAHGRSLGALVLVSSHRHRRYDREDLRFAEEVARRAAFAVENARLYRDSQQALRTRDEVLGVVAHDLRNPVAAISLSATLLLRRLPEGETGRAAQRHGEAILRASDRANRLIRDLLEVTKFEAGRVHLDRARVPVADVVLEAVDGQRPAAAQAEVELRVELPELPPAVNADRERLLQVLENLIGNALKFTRPMGRVSVGAAATDGEVLFWVSDTGAGIPADHLPHIFERFWQAPGEERRGAGLGLVICKRVVEAHGGRIWAESRVGAGSTFFFTVPGAPALRDDAEVAAPLPS